MPATTCNQRKIAKEKSIIYTPAAKCCKIDTTQLLKSNQKQSCQARYQVGSSSFCSLIDKTSGKKRFNYVSDEIISKVPFKQDLRAFSPPQNPHKKLEKKWG